MGNATERAILGAPVAGARGTVASSFQYLLRGDETLELQVFCRQFTDTTVKLLGRVWRTSTQDLQVFSHDMVARAGAFTTQGFGLTPGALLNLRLTTDDTTVPLGMLYGRVRLLQGSGGAAIPIATLLQGYFNDRSDRGWPGSALDDTHAGLGVLRDESWGFGGAPLTINGITPTFARSRLVAGIFTLTTAAIGPARDVILIVSNHIGTEIGRFTPAYAHPAGQAVTYTIAPGVSQDPAAITSQRIISMPLDFDMPASSFLAIFVGNQQVGDVFTVGALNMRSWLDFNAS